MRIAAILAFVTLLFAQTEPPVVLVEGVVTETGTSTPLPSVQVRLTGTRSSNSAAVSLHGSTGPDGRFRISAPPGNYTITWQREGLFDPLNNGQFQENGTKLNLAAGKAEPPLNLSLTSGGVIAGQIVNSDGSPASRTSVAAMQINYGPRGERTLRMIETEDSNDRGEYRLYWIPPGDYVVGFSPSASVIPPTLTSTSGPPSIHDRTFYPGTTDVAKARPISVGPHSETDGVNFSIRDVPVFSVSGKANYPFVTPPAGQASSLNQNPSVTIMAAEGGSQRYGAIPSAPRNGVEQGFFEVRGIPAGHYNLLATVGQPAAAVQYAGEIPIDIASEDLKGVTLTLRPSVEIPGRIVMTPPAPFPPEIQFMAADNMISSNSLRATPGPAGEFTLKGTEGSSLALLSNLPTGFYVADFRQGEQSRYGDGILHIAEINAPIQIVIASSPTSISGTVVFAEGQRRTKTAAVLVPDAPRRQNYFLYPSANVDDSGHFTITGIAPGSYKLFAAGSAWINGWKNSDFISKYDDLGIPVTVAETTRQGDFQVKVIDVDRQN